MWEKCTGEIKRVSFLSGNFVRNGLNRKYLAKFARYARGKMRCRSSYRARVILQISTKFGNLKSSIQNCTNRRLH